MLLLFKIYFVTVETTYFAFAYSWKHSNVIQYYNDDTKHLFMQLEVTIY